MCTQLLFVCEGMMYALCTSMSLDMFYQITHDNSINFIFLFFTGRHQRIMHTNFFTFGSFLAFIFCLTDVSCFRRKCTGSSNNYCSGESTNMRAVCKGGYCYCDGQDYDYYSCLRKLFCLVKESGIRYKYLR